VKLSDIWQCWDKFWFSPGSTLPVCIFRILLGLLILQVQLLTSRDWVTWYTDKGVYTLSTCQQYLGAPCINLLTFLPSDERTIYGFMAVFLIAIVCFTIGLFTRWSTIVVFLMLTTLDHRNPLILNGGDTYLRCCMFWMMFAPAGELLSLDHYLKQWWRGEKPAAEADPQRSRWVWRLLQLQLVAVYVQCFWSKTLGNTWLDGTALYYVLHEREYLRFPLPINIENIWVSKLLTWGTLVIEFSMWSLIWIKELRYYVLAAALMLHLGIEYTMNIPVFEQAMIASLILFVEPDHIRRAGAWIRDTFKIYRGSTGAASPVTVKDH
jgi:hypothetical protein